MTLIFILIALGLDHLSGGLEHFRSFNWFIRLHYRLERRLAHYRFWDGSFGLLILLSIPLIGLLILVSFFDDRLWIAEALLTLIVLIYCVAPKDLNNRLHDYIVTIDGGHEEASISLADGLINKTLVNDGDNDEIAIIKSTIIEAHKRTFAIIFWFFVLGIAGAFLYRLLDKLNDELHDIRSGYADSARILLAILEWPSSRLMIISLALGGNLVSALLSWEKTEQLSFEVNKKVLIESGIGALQYIPDLAVPDRKKSYWISELRLLINRTLFIWLAILGVMTLSGAVA